MKASCVSYRYSHITAVLKTVEEFDTGKSLNNNVRIKNLVKIIDHSHYLFFRYDFFDVICIAMFFFYQIWPFPNRFLSDII